MATSGFGDKSLPMPIPIPQTAVASYGDKSVSQSKPVDSIDPIIHSLSWINDSLDSMEETVGDLELMKVDDLEKLLQKYLSKQAVSEAIIEALSKQTSFVKETGFLVKNQVKAAEVQQRTLKKNAVPGSNASSASDDSFDEIFGGSSSGKSKSTSKSSSGKDFSFLKAYQDALKGAHDFAFNPMSMVDKLAELPFKGLDKLFGGKKNKKDDSFRSDAIGPEQDFYGPDIGKNLEETVDKTFTGVSDDFKPVFDGFERIFNDFERIFSSQQSQDGFSYEVLGSSPLGESSRALVPYGGGGGDDGFSYEVLGSSLFGGMLSSPVPHGADKSNRGSGGLLEDLTKGGLTDKGVTSSEDDVQEKAAKIGMKADTALFDTFEKPEKSNFGRFLGDHVMGGIRTVGEKGKSLLEALLGPLLVGAFILLAPLLPKAIEFFRDVFLPFLKEKVGPFITQTLIPFLGRVKDFIVDTLFPKFIIPLFNFVKDTLIPKVFVPLYEFIRDTLIPHVIIPLGKVVGGTILEFFGSLAKLANGEISLTDFFFGEHSLGAILADHVAKQLDWGVDSAKTDLLKNAVNVGAPFAALGAAIGPILFPVIPPPFSSILGALLLGGSATGIVTLTEQLDKWIKKFTGGGINSGVPLSEEGTTKFTGLRNEFIERHGVDPEDVINDGSWISYADTNYDLYSALAKYSKERRELRDGIITSDGQIIETDPEDNIYAFKGDVSINPVNSVPSFSNKFYTNNANTDQSSNSGTVNNYYNSSNYDMSGFSPFSEFCPVGV